MSLRTLAAAPLLCLCFGVPLSAHEIGLVQVKVAFAADSTFTIDIPVDPITTYERLVVAEGMVLPEGQTPLEVARVGIQERAPEIVKKIRVIFDDQPVPATLSYVEQAPLPTGPLALLRLSGAIPEGASTFRFQYRLIFTRYALQILVPDGGEPTVAWLEGAELSDPFPVVKAEPPSRWAVVQQYLWLGFTHILPKGLDHILFVLGLFFLSTRWAPLLWQVSAFTLAHTLTLGLATYGVVSLPSSIVEPLIALSIAYIALENLRQVDLGWKRVAVVFGFGLLHGLGFAGVLSELGLPASRYLTALLSFNVGVELGQLAVIALAFVLFASWSRHQAWYQKRVVVPASLLIAATGLYWTIERVWQALA